MCTKFYVKCLGVLKKIRGDWVNKCNECVHGDNYLFCKLMRFLFKKKNNAPFFDCKQFHSYEEDSVALSDMDDMNI